MRTDAARNRDHLLATAQAMVAVGEEPTLNELARRAGVGVATVYRHFPDATALMAAVMETELAQLGATLDRAAAEEDPAAGLRALFVDVLALEMEHPLIARLVHAPHPAVAQHFAKLQAAAEALVRRAKRAKALRPGVSAEDVCRLLQGVHAAAIGSPEPTAAARRYADIVLSGLCPPTP
jgi:AcrR family transcriptional regulator